MKVGVLGHQAGWTGVERGPGGLNTEHLQLQRRGLEPHFVEV